MLVCVVQLAINQSNMNDNALEELSLAREPRQKGNSKDTVARENNLPKFSEWAAGRQSILDINTLSKHVKQMVEVRQSLCGGHLDMSPYSFNLHSTHPMAGHLSWNLPIALCISSLPTI